MTKFVMMMDMMMDMMMCRENRRIPSCIISA